MAKKGGGVRALRNIECKIQRGWGALKEMLHAKNGID